MGGGMSVARARVEYWEKWGGSEREAMQAVVQAFNQSQDQHEVVMRDTGDWSSSPDLPAFLSAQREGTPPDVIGLEDHQVADLASLGAIAPLGSLPHIADCRDGFTSLGLYSGALYAAPISVDLVTLYINLSAVRGSPFEGAHLPPTSDEFDLELVRFERAGKIGLVPSYPGWWPHAWARFFGGAWIDRDGRFTPDRPENVRAFEWVRGVRDRWAAGLKLLPEGVAALLSSTVNPVGRSKPDPFLSGHVAMVFDGDWLVKRLIAVPGFEWRPAGFPGAHGRPTCLVVGDLLAVPSGAKSPDGAAEFVSFATRPEQLERLALGQGKISPLREWSDEFVALHPNPHIREFRDMLDSADLFTDPRLPGWLACLDRIKTAFVGVWQGKETPQDALSRIR